MGIPLAYDDPSKRIACEFALLLLSLDLTSGYWREMEIACDPHGPAKERVRGYIRKHEALQRLGEEQWHPRMEIEIINELLDSLHDLDPMATFQRFIETNYLGYAFAPPWRGEWDVLVSRIHSDAQSALLLQGFAPDRLAALSQLSQEWELAKRRIPEEIAGLSKRPKSPWDEEQFTAYATDPEGFYDPELTPLTHLKLLLRYLRFGKVWESVVVLLPPHEMEMLSRWAMVGMGAPAAAEIPIEYRRR